MKTLCIATVLALLAGSAAQAGSIIDTLIKESGVKIDDKSITVGKQKFNRSDIDAIINGLNGLDKSMKDTAKDRPAATTDREKPVDTAPPARADETKASPSRRDDAALSRIDDRAAPRSDDRPSVSTPAKDNPAAHTEQKVAVTKPAPVAFDPNSPVGEWIPEDGDGRVRIRVCGQALCGVVSVADPKETDRNNPDASKRSRQVLGMPILIDMRPKGDRWEGQVYNPKNGKTYTSNISLKSPTVLRVEGCLFGGMFCGGEDWTRAKDAPQG
jgi:uncharacterized protein (DUF2147 family)